MVQRQHQDMYSMVEVASMVLPNSLDTLDALATEKNLNTLARVSASFWKNSATKSNPQTPSSSHVKISSLY
ncbi:hypothetical protein O0I10_011049 [Lichtheimia ornata]|uniref:Uncharacterized protein n=1 Tax=Lichtheimia ornata TaxID=688661 RepID=A0AAD7XQT1_9FUNG|nr:uncharacterized protein O0I10_011049 [Lichtheimia ornata]KAJ8653299.1 hypothetical protein O0I10_011049 [Lichtheimia ornata]